MVRSRDYHFIVSMIKGTLVFANDLSLIFTSDQLRPFLDDSAGGFVERLFEALEESRSARGNKGAGEKNRKRDLKVSKHPTKCIVTVLVGN